MLINNSIGDGIISHNEFLEILKEKKNIMVLRMKTKLRMFKKSFDFSSKIIINNEIYCILCKKETENKNPKVLQTNHKILILKSICSVCNNKKSRFISKNEGSGLLSSLGIRTPLSKISGLNILF